MKLWLITLICLPLISICCSLDFTESISMKDNGGLYVRSNSLDGTDGASGIGNQNYTRTLSIGEKSRSLESNYNYRNISQIGTKMYDNYTNYYYITGESSSETKHSISVRSNQNIESRGSVFRDDGSFLTNFVIKSDSGNLSETLSIKDGAKPIYIAEAKLDGNFTVSSSASENVDKWDGYNLDGLMLKMKSVELSGERGVISRSLKKPELVLEGGFQISQQEEAANLTREGNVFARAGNYAQALVYYDEALKFDRNSVSSSVTWIVKGLALYNLKRNDEADKAYEQALRLDPNSQEAMVYRAANLIELSRTSEAIDILNEATNKYPNYEEAWYQKGSALMDIKDYQRALNAFNSTISLNKDNALAWFFKGQLMYQLATKMYSNSQLMLQSAITALNEAKRLDREGLGTDVDMIIKDKINPKLTGDSKNAGASSDPGSESAITAANENQVNGPSNTGTNLAEPF